MAGACMSKLIIICIGIQLCFGESLSNDCGRLSYDEPAVIGRNVTLIFDPVQANTNFAVEWEDTGNYFPGWWSVSEEEGHYHLVNFSLVVKTSTDDQGRSFHAKYGSCTSEAIKLKLELIDHNSCGMWYERTSNVRPGGTVELGYLPTWNIINHEASYSRIFEITNSTFPDGCQIQNLPGVYEIRALGYNHEYVLTITLNEAFVNGRYRVQCTTGRNPDTYTEYINVTIPERPNNLELLDTQSFEDCHHCIVGTLHDNLDIRCYVTGGTAPLHVNITVGGKSTNELSNNDGVYVANIQLTTTRHMTVVQCFVTNIALDSPLMSEARLYILVRPLEPVFDVPEIVDAEPPIYPTCTSSGARPASNVEFKSSNSEIIEASKMNRTETANTFNTSITLLRMDKVWNLQNLTCCVNHLTYTSPWCQTKQLIYKFKPESVKVALAVNYTAILPYYTYNVTCTVLRAYPACSVTWVWPEGVDKLDVTESFEGTNVVTTEAAISLKVSREENLEEVRCTAWCSDITYNQSDTHVIFVPYERTISFNVSSPINLTESSTTVVECTAYWATTVWWLDSDNRTTLRVVDCGTDAACVRLEDVSKKNGGNYTCMANDSWFNVSKQLTVTVEGLPDQHTLEKTGDQTSSTIIVSIMACIVLLLAVIVLVVVLKRRNSKKSEMMQNDSTVPAAGPSGSVVSYASVQESDTYSTPLPKSQRPKADNSNTVQDDDTYAMPLPKSQRTNANTAKIKSADTPKQLIYVDLDLKPSSTSGSGAMAKPGMRKDGPETEYVDIDFNKKAVPLPVSEEEDNMYANQ